MWIKVGRVFSPAPVYNDAPNMWGGKTAVPLKGKDSTGFLIMGLVFNKFLANHAAVGIAEADDIKTRAPITGGELYLLFAGRQVAQGLLDDFFT